jgi:hypothetical protein
MDLTTFDQKVIELARDDNKSISANHQKYNNNLPIPYSLAGKYKYK